MMILDPGMAILDLMVTHRPPLPAFVSRQVVSARRYFLDLRPGTNAPLSVACGGYEQVRGDYVVERDDFPYCCIEFVAAGHGTLVVGRREIELRPGSIFSYGPGVAHAIRTDPRLRLRKYYIDFAGRHAAEGLRAAGLAPGRHLRISQPHEVREIFDLLQQCGLAQSAHSPALCRQLLAVLLTKIAERGLRDDSLDPKGFATYKRFKRFLTAERRRLTSVANAARDFRISSAYACRLFQRFDSASPYQYLVRQRMNLAADLLAGRGSSQGRMLVKHVAEHLGFADQYQFSRTFKRVFGVSPAVFQRQQP